jgi:heptosyltransferase II
MSAEFVAPAPGSLGRLVVRAPNWVGDLVMATPVLHAAALDARFCDVRIVLRGHLADVLADGPLAERIVPLARDADEVRVYRGLAPDAVMLLSNSLGAAWRAFRAAVPVRAGAALSYRRPLLTHAVRPPSSSGRRVPIPTAHLHADVAGLLGVRPKSLAPRLDVRPETAQRAREVLIAAGLRDDEPHFVVCPGAAFGAAKLWPPERFAEAAREIALERGWRAVVTGAPSERALVEDVAQRLGNLAIAPDSSSGGLALLRAWTADARLVLVGDSGPRWFAAAFGVPCVSVMGPNFPELTQSSMERARIVRVEGLECSPCLERRCPLGHHCCMQDLPTAAVVRAARELLAEAAPA